MYRKQIEIMESHLASMSQGQTLTPQGMRFLYVQCYNKGSLLTTVHVVEQIRSLYIIIMVDSCILVFLISLRLSFINLEMLILI